MKRYFLLGAMLLGLFTYGQNTDGTLDSTFTSKGWTHLYFFNDATNNYYEYGYRTLVQNDGRYVVAFDMNGPMLARYNADGTLDKSFGENGFSTSIPNVGSADAALQSDGKILVAVSWYNGANQDFAVVRYNFDGTLDNSFGTDGMSTPADIFGSDDYIRSMVIQPDGKIVVTGYATNPDNGTTDFALVRYNSDGKSLDNNFGSGGIVATDIIPGVPDNYSSSNDNAYRLAIQPIDGKIVVVGNAYGPTTGFHSEVTLVRYNPDGSLDTDFGTGGIVTNYIGNLNDDAYAVAIQSDGKIVVAGDVQSDDGAGGYTYDFLVMRYNSDGKSLDADFGSNGVVTNNFGSTEAFAGSLALQGDGKIIVAGSISNTTTGRDFAVARYTATGTLDPGFGTNGVTTTDLGSVYDFAGNMALLGDGKIILTGGYNIYSGNSDFAVVRYTSSGSLDATFNGTGKLIGFYMPGADSYLYAMAVQSNGKIVVAGVGRNPSTGSNDLGVARYNPDGTLDNTFGSGGIVMTNFGEGYYFQQPSAVAIQSDGKIVVGGQMSSITSLDFALARFTSTGALDNTFDGDGKVITDLGGDEALFSLAVQGDGKIVVVGNIFNNDFTVVRYNTNGSLDNTFGTGGKLTTDFNGGEDVATAVAIQSDGKILVGGRAFTGSNYDFAVARYTSTGILDRTFGNRGKVTTDFSATGENADDRASSLALQSDGKIVLGGMSEVVTGGTSDYGRLALARFTSTGALDNSFDADGKAITDFGVSFLNTQVALQSDGKLIVGGQFYDFNSEQYNWVLLRYSSNGALDGTFGTDGKVFNDFGSAGEFHALGWYNGKLYVAGTVPSAYAYAGLLEAYKAAAGYTPSLPVVSIDDRQVTEDAGTATLTVSLDQASASSITINYATQDGTATSKGRYPDYRTARGTVTIPAGSTSASINITIYNDNLLESDETFSVVLSLTKQMAKLATVGDGTGQVTIQDNDAGITLANAAQANLQAPEKGRLSAKAYPNPSNGYFTLQLQSASTEPATIKVTDVSGRVIESKAGVVANGSIQLGTSYRAGVYYVQIEQGSEKRTIKLVKQ